jgi:hypothetical protein
MSTSDGQIRLCDKAAAAGTWPPVDVAASLSRLGANARGPALNAICASLRLQLLQTDNSLMADMKPTASDAINAKGDTATPVGGGGGGGGERNVLREHVEKAFQQAAGECRDEATQVRVLWAALKDAASDLDTSAKKKL